MGAEGFEPDVLHLNVQVRTHFLQSFQRDHTRTDVHKRDGVLNDSTSHMLILSQAADARLFPGV